VYPGESRTSQKKNTVAKANFKAEEDGRRGGRRPKEKTKGGEGGDRN